MLELLFENVLLEAPKDLEQQQRLSLADLAQGGRGGLG